MEVVASADREDLQHGLNMVMKWSDLPLSKQKSILLRDTDRHHRMRPLLMGCDLKEPKSVLQVHDLGVQVWKNVLPYAQCLELAWKSICALAQLIRTLTLRICKLFYRYIRLFLGPTLIISYKHVHLSSKRHSMSWKNAQTAERKNCWNAKPILTCSLLHHKFIVIWTEWSFFMFQHSQALPSYWYGHSFEVRNHFWH